MLGNNGGITDFTYFTDLGQLPGCFDPLAQGDVQSPIDRLSVAADDPEPVFCIAVAYRRVAAGLELVRDHAAVLAVVQPFEQVALCHFPHLVERRHYRAAWFAVSVQRVLLDPQRVEDVGKFCLLWSSPDTHDLPECLGLPWWRFRVEL